MGVLMLPFIFIYIVVVLFQQQAGAVTVKDMKSCDYVEGKWVTDYSYPIYNDSTCTFIEKEFDCLKNGRPDQLYIHYRWQSYACNLQRFDGRNFLEKMRGKSIMFVGDSLSRNQWMSLVCLLHSAVPDAEYTTTLLGDAAVITFKEYGVKVMREHNVFLVDVVREKMGRVLKLDSVEQNSKLWNRVDVIVFNTWHWWNRRGSGQPWDYIKVGNKTYKDMNRMAAYEIALNTWANWMNTKYDPSKTMAFFQGISPSHYNGIDWEEAKGKTCVGQNQPVTGSSYHEGKLAALGILKKVIAKVKKPVTLLDITNLSLLRKDGHPSVYGLTGAQGMDCTHWCLPGLPDTWNQILYNYF